MEQRKERLTVTFNATGNRKVTNQHKLVLDSDMSLEQIRNAIEVLKGRKVEIIDTLLIMEPTVDQLAHEWRKAVADGQTSAGFQDWVAFHREAPAIEPAAATETPAEAPAAEAEPFMTFTTKATHEVDCYDLDEAIAKLYPGTNFETAASEEMGHDDNKKYTFKKEPLSEYWQKSLDKFKANPSDGRDWATVPQIMQDMVNRDLIPEGKYIISCD